MEGFFHILSNNIVIYILCDWLSMFVFMLQVRDKGIWISSYRHVNKHRAGSILPGMFPSGNTCNEQLDCEDEKNILDVVVDDAEEIPQNGTNRDKFPLEDGNVEFATLPLERCLRILPHDQDTGGFFIAVFKKISTLKGELTVSCM